MKLSSHLDIIKRRKYGVDDREERKIGSNLRKKWCCGNKILIKKSENTEFSDSGPIYKL